jgi:carboxyl-terminal processing protease
LQSARGKSVPEFFDERPFVTYTQPWLGCLTRFSRRSEKDIPDCAPRKDGTGHVACEDDLPGVIPARRSGGAAYLHETERAMPRRVLLASKALLCFLFFVSGVTRVGAEELQTSLVPDVIHSLRDVLEKGRLLESQRRWSEALSHYEQALREHPGDRMLSERLDIAKIHFSLDRRYDDPSFRGCLKSLEGRASRDLYAEVLLKIDSHYVTDPPWHELVNRGTRSLDAALVRQAFCDVHLPHATQEDIRGFRSEMYRVLQGRTVGSRRDAQVIVGQVADLANRRLGMQPAAVIFEYICGAAGGLDDYSTFLTPSQLNEVYSQIEGSFVGLGVELKADQGMLVIVHVLPGSPAERSGIRAGDRIVAVNGQSTEPLSTDEAAALLQGEEGTYADVTVRGSSDEPRQFHVRREHVEVPSIENPRIVDEQLGIAYLKLSSFQKTTSRDLDAALWKLYNSGMRGLILDVRGNPGGLLTSAVEVADKFVFQGNIVSTRGRNPQEAFRYDARWAGTWRVPLVVLIDGDSASASEIFAAAIRHYGRGPLVGSRSYGKGSVQGIFPLGAAGVGVRLTTAKFYSPGGQPISGTGVQPDVAVREAARATELGTQDDLVGNTDAVLEAGLLAARRQLAAQ